MSPRQEWELSTHATDRVRATAVRALAHHDPHALLPNVARLAEDRDTDVRWHGVWVFGQVKNPAHLPLLLKRLEDADDRVRDRAFSSLADPAFAAGLPKLVPYLKNEKDMYRAMWAVVGTGGPPAVVALVDELHAGNEVGGTIHHALHKLTGQTFQTREQWLTWWAREGEATWRKAAKD